MLSKIIAQLVIFTLRYKRLSGEQKTLVTSALLENLQAFPIRDIIQFDANGTLLINARKMDMDSSIQIKESGASLKNSYARRLIHDQLTFKAINLGVHNGLSPESIMFSKAVLWVLQEEDNLIKKFSGEIDDI